MCWWKFLRLGLSVAFEGGLNALHLLAFPFRRRRIRERIRALMCQRAAPVLVLLLLPLSGCAHFPGSSFGQQMDELQWTTTKLLEMPHWHESLWDDVKVLADPEPDQLPETLMMLGW